MAHSNQIREFLLTNKGVDLIDVYAGSGTVLTGSARTAQESNETAEKVLREEEIGRKKRQLERKRQAIEAQVAALRAEYEAEAEELTIGLGELKLKEQVIMKDRGNMLLRRGGNGLKPSSGRSGRSLQ